MKTVLLMPFIYVYKAVKTVLLLPFNLLKFILNGFVVLCYLLFKLIIFVFYIVFFIPIKLFEISDKKEARKKRIKDREEAFQKALEEKEKLSKLNLERLEQHKKEQEELVTELVDRRKSRVTDDLYSTPTERKIGDIINDGIVAFIRIPQGLINKVKNGYNNSSFVKNSRNQKLIEREELLINFEGDDAEKSEKKIIYEYNGKDASGKVVTGHFPAYSKVEVHSFLLSEGMEVYSIKTSKWIQFIHSEAGKRKGKKIKISDLIFFLNQLSTYIKAGIPLVDSLKILEKQYKQKSYMKTFRGMIYNLTMGDNFSDAILKQGEAFPKLLINMIKTSELTGELPETLDEMATYFSETEETRKQMVTAMMYPSIVFIVAIAVVTFILMFVIPRFSEIFLSFGADEIPKLTQIVLSVSKFLTDNSLMFFGAIVIFLFILVYLYKNVKIIRSVMQYIMMKIPVMGTVIIYNEVTMFTKTFSSLLKHNVFITDSMEVLNRITENEIYKMLILDTITNLAKGDIISKAFENHWAFPIPAYEMLVTGEKTGQLAEMMEKVANFYQSEHRNSVTKIKTVIEPILLLFLTVVVGAIILAIIIPMFQLYGQIQGQ